MDILSLTLLCCLIVTLILFLISGKKKKILGMPGPYKWPIIGNSPQFDLKQPQVGLETLAQRYGPIVHLKMLHWDIVVLNSADAIQEALVKRGSDFAGRPYLFRVWYAMSKGEDLVFQSYSPSWSKFRKAVHKALSTASLGSCNTDGLIQHQTEGLIEYISSMKGEEFDPYKPVYRRIANVILFLLFGENTGIRDFEEEVEKIERFDRLLNASLSMHRGIELDILPWLRYVPNKTFSILKEAARIRDDVCSRLYHQYKERYKQGGTAGMVGDLIGQRELQIQQGKDFVLSEESIMVSIGDLIIAGTDTTATNIVALILHLANHPEMQAKVQQEIDQVVGTSGPPSLSDKEKMHYTSACILESLRHTTGPLSLLHNAMTDSSILGYDIPKDTQIWINMYGLHHNPETWENPHVFEPSRFLDDEGALLPLGHPVRRNLMPFGTGLRGCMGEALAKHESFLVSIALLQRFTFLPGEGAEVAADSRTFTMGVISHPRPFKLRAKKRVL